MKRILIRYKTKPDRAEENEVLVAKVFQQLRQRAPAGIRYASVKLADGATFVHLVEIDTEDGSNPLSKIEAFKAFQKDITVAPSRRRQAM
ncbi:MAG: hypothetical protein WD871_04400 [Xanthobacteraceae bacterium]